MPVYGIDHVQLSIPAGGEPLVRHFYGEVLGLKEIPKPPNLAARGAPGFSVVLCNYTWVSNPTFVQPRERIRLFPSRISRKLSRRSLAQGSK